MIADLRRLSPRPLVGVVNTHEHFDHTFGNAAFREEYGAVPITAHESRRETARDREEQRPRPRTPGHEIAEPRSRGHDLLLGHGRSTSATGRSSWCTRVAATPAATSSYGSGTRTCCWPATSSRSPACRRTATTASRSSGRWSLDLVLELVGPDTVVVPGHGAPVDRDFVQEQRSAIGVVAQTIRDLAGARRTRRPGAGRDRVALSEGAPRGRRTPWLRAAAAVREAAAARMSAPELTTERLLLRRWQDSDLAPFAELNADPEVMRHLREPMTREESDAFAARIEEHLETDGYGLWAVEVRETGAFVGFTGLARQTFEAPFNPSVEVGWRLAREAWGHGYATEAATRGARLRLRRAGARRGRVDHDDEQRALAGGDETPRHDA